MNSNATRRWKAFKRSWQLYVVIALPVIYLFVFNYLPLYGIQIAFRQYDPTVGIGASPWVGLDNVMRFVNSYNFQTTVVNTVTLSLYNLAVGLPVPIILALMLNECRSPRLKKLVQTVTYAPYFISTVVMVSMILMFLSVNNGLINNLIAGLGGGRTNFMANPAAFKTIYVLTDVWQNMGYSSIIFLAALTAIDPTLYEAAVIDGATRLQKIIHIDLPGIAPTIIIVLILRFGQIMNVGFEKIYLMQNDLNLKSSEIIATYIYKLGIERADFSYSAAVGLFNSVVNTAMLVGVNAIARRFSESSLW